VSWTYELPVGPGKQFASGGSPVIQKLLEGWAVNGITLYQSGEPLNVTVASSLLNTGHGQLGRCDLLVYFTTRAHGAVV
jgi:hypothetical protein